MASLQLTVRLYDTTERIDRNLSGVADTTTGEHFQHVVQTVGTSEETLAIASDITGGSDPGWCLIVNRDATNYCQIGISTGAYFAQRGAGQSMLVQLDPAVTDLYLKAHTAAVKLEIYIRER